MKKQFSVSEIEDLVSRIGLLSLPNTGRAIQYRAQNEGWEFDFAPSQGGRKGLKKIYTLPLYVVEELREKGILHLLQDASFGESSKEVESPEPQYTRTLSVKADTAAQSYDAWAAAQDKSCVLPVRYYKEVFASAGSGAVPWDVEPDVMWFRDSFFIHLGVKPADCFCTRIDGDSMFPTLIDRGTALWHATGRYTREGIYLFRQYDELRVKRLVRISSYIYSAISDNPNKSIYPTVEFDLSAQPDASFEILGRYLWSCGIAK